MALLLAGCSAEQEAYDGGQQKGLMPVLFSAGNVNRALTRASASYMPAGSHFRCAMFFHAGASDNDGTEYADPILGVNTFSNSLSIDGNLGEATYNDGKSFYWQNRLNHVFLALADNHHQAEAPQVNVGETVTYDLTRTETMQGMTDQPDPMVAHVIMKPAGATSEANRVKLFFKHQFAQVQVNLKNSQDESVTIDETLIERVELLGVAEMAYVAYAINSDGTVLAAKAEPINIENVKYSATKKDNPYGSLFNMFERTTPTPGYLKSFECIAFGTLQGIRITWKESAATDAVVHKVTFKGVKNLALESGKKYIYNVELRRSQIAQVTPEIADWGEDKTPYEADGTIMD